MESEVKAMCLLIYTHEYIIAKTSFLACARDYSAHSDHERMLSPVDMNRFS